MRNSQNNVTVETLVAKYRNYVNEHCPKIASSFVDEDGYFADLMPFNPDGNADEQLIVTLYKKITGRNADEQIVEALSQYAEKFYDEALTEQEMSFLCEQFSEVVSYEFAHRHEWSLGSSSQRISEERIRLVKEFVNPKKGAKIFIADTEYCDLAVLFPECVIYGFTGWNYKQKEVWALGQIRLFAAGVRSEIVSGEEINENSDEYSYILPAKGTMDVVIFRVNENKCPSEISGTKCNDIEALYDLLKPNGKMLFFSEYITEMAGKKADKYETPVYDFRIRRTKEKAISAIVAYEEGDRWDNRKTKNIMLSLCKCENSNICIKDEVRSKIKYINSDELDPEILWPGYYWATQPTDGIPLSSIVRLCDVRLCEEEELAKFVKGTGWTLLEQAKNMPLVLTTMLGDSFKDSNLWRKAFSNVSDPAFEEERMRFGVTKEPCVLLSGSSKDLKVGYTTSVPNGGFAYMNGCCMIPLNGIDVRYIAALLFEPSVKEQVLTICDGHLNNHVLSLVIDKIIIPNHNDKERLSFMVEANYEALLSSQEELKREHDNYTYAVRMRKHALSQSLSSIGAKFNALNKCRIRHNGELSDDTVLNPLRGTTVKEVFEFLSIKIEEMMPVLDHIADVEYSFSKPEYINPEEFMERYIEKEEKGWLNFKPFVSWEKGNNLAKQDIKDNKGLDVIKKGKALNTFVFPIDALEKIFDNILSNAKAYAFIDDSRKDYQLKFSWHTDGVSMIIEIENNGTPIPEDRDTASLLEYGVSTDLHQDGHNGIGCNEIKDIMARYNGRVEIVSTPKEEFTVKYVLTFDNANVLNLQ